MPVKKPRVFVEKVSISHLHEHLLQISGEISVIRKELEAIKKNQDDESDNVSEHSLNLLRIRVNRLTRLAQD